MHAIMVALDGSSFAHASIPVALGLARQLGAPLDLVTVHEPPPGVHSLSGSSAQEHVLERELMAHQREVARRALHDLREQLTQLRDAPVVTTTELTGAPAEQLRTHARDSSARLLVVTTHGHGGLSRQWMGSVTDALVRDSTIPIVTVRPDTTQHNVVADLETDWSLKRLLITLDGSANAERILEPLRELIPVNVAFHLLRVVVPPSPVLRALMPADEDERERAEQRLSATIYLDHVATRLQAQGIHTTHRVMTDRVPAHAIADGAHEPDIDMVAIATHGRSGIGRALLGSVADKVLRTVNKPVLLYRISEYHETTIPAP
jgi:nucleotide-binding universal stress UspA family protein